MPIGNDEPTRVVSLIVFTAVIGMFLAVPERDGDRLCARRSRPSCRQQPRMRLSRRCKRVASAHLAEIPSERLEL